MNRFPAVLQLIVLSLTLSAVASGQAPAPYTKAQADKFKKETAVVAGSIDQIVNATVPGYGLLQRTKAAYIDGYGAIFTLEVAFEPPRNPFNSSKSPAEVRASVNQRRKDLREKLVELVKQRVPALGAILPTESMAIVMYLVNSNPADLPDFPANLVISVKKQDVLDFEAQLISAADLANKVSIREF